MVDKIPPTSGMVAQNRSRSFSVVCTDHLQLATLERGDQGLICATKGDGRFSQNCKIKQDLSDSDFDPSALVCWNLLGIPVKLEV